MKGRVLLKSPHLQFQDGKKPLLEWAARLLGELVVGTWCFLRPEAQPSRGRAAQRLPILAWAPQMPLPSFFETLDRRKLMKFCPKAPASAETQRTAQPVGF